MTDPVRGLVADDRKARKLADTVAAPMLTVTAPDVLRAAGIEDITAVPTAVWHVVFPDNP
ncbi:hypothetical protein [Rhodoplanes roseus]|uniref:Uncharacterized protein n=1 Tax=Rhodoplanes roseus TaxID=29409 RepID=A0A327L473_9BRAD|nr:hypothetical protein [Rhodoplanes roseus]RAI44795.1 hypothetical protein CH341_07150 [Rhodoplanes roseus]